MNPALDMIVLISELSVNYAARAEAGNLFRLIEAFRKHGLKCSNINPVPIKETIR
jgi:hypothetical protein